MKQNKPKELRSNIKVYKSYFKRKTNNPLLQIWITMREYGFFILPIFPTYLMIYNVLFGSGDENGYGWAYLTCGICILLVDVAAYFLRRIYRSYKFEKYSKREVNIYKGNIWNCPHCGNRNKLVAPCTTCGIYPTLIKTKGEAPKMEAKSAKDKKLRKEYEEYVPQFK